MAVVWAKEAGNWTTASIWAFWNETTQQIENYGQVPQLGDVVYFNGYDVVGGSINLGSGTLRNDTNPYTQRNGGKFTTPTTINVNFVGNIVAEFTIFNFGVNSQTFSLTGNLECVSTQYTHVLGCSTGSSTISVSITGNVRLGNNKLLYISTSRNRNITITGRLQLSGLLIDGLSATTRSLTINGDLDVTSEIVNYQTPCVIGGSLTTTSSLSHFTTLSVGGNLTITESSTIYCSTSLTINGTRITYTGVNLDRGIQASAINIGDPANFGWVNTYEYADYPSEGDVKKDVYFDWGRKVGTYDIENMLPPESVVLKDYEYGDIDDRKTGTLENEVNVEVDNTNTINVFPYKRRRNG